MHTLDGELVVSPTDFTRFMECRHATWLDLCVARGTLERPAEGVDETLQALFDKGIEHERAYLERLRDRGLEVVEIAYERSASREQLEAAEAATEDAMAAGADVVYQGTFFDGTWRGHADFLLRRDDRPGRWAWSYDVADTKLARRMKVPALLQMAVYADRLTGLQGVEPERLVVVTGDGEERPFRFADAAAYAATVRSDLLGWLEGLGEPDPEGVPPARPEPVRYCDQCRWLSRCSAGWRATDDLSLVAGMRRDHARALRESGIGTVRALAASGPGGLPETIGEPARVRLAAQAALQVRERDTGTPHHEVLAPEPARGLALLPEPSPGDVFFDMEGDPWLGDHGLEYLLGVWDADGFGAYWATDPADEKRAFEQLMDHLMAAWDRDPGMHVYHYAAYEPTKLKALSGRHSTRAAELDRLLRGERLVDLYTVVRQGIRISKGSYSIKQVEAFYWGHTRRHEGVSDALGSVVAFERWLDSRDQALLDDIAAYNEVDCRSTQALRDWLETVRAGAGGDDAFPRPLHGDGSPSEAVEEEATEVERLRAELLAGLPEHDRTPEQQATRLLGDLLDWHRREALPEWWDYYRRLELDDEQLVGDPAAVGQLGTPTLVGTVKRSTVWRMPFPSQETKLGPDEAHWIDPQTRGGVGTVLTVDPEVGELTLKVGNTRGAPTATALVPGAPIAARQQRARLLDLARWVLAHGIDSPLPEWRAARDLLLRRAPRLRGERGGRTSEATALRRPGESGEDALCRLANALDHAVLPVQGPPGTGKTWAGARTILRLVAEGKRVGVTAFSHKAISNLLDAIANAADEAGVDLDVLQKAGEHERCRSTRVRATDANEEVEDAVTGSGLDVVAGTAWLFARSAMQGSVDVLVVDEAGQLSLANVLAISGAASSVVLLGDPQQLAQPVHGQHPEGAEVSAMEHLLDGASTVRSDRGLLLDTTWRMHDEVASFVSALSYDGLLRVEAGCSGQRVRSSSALGGTGLRLSLVEHVDNAAASTEEALEVRRLVEQVLAGGEWTDRLGSRRALRPDDVMVLTPFNAQVNRIRSCLGPLAGPGGVRVGTVDKFQGQEAPVVLYSLASSSVADAPRGLEFLFSVNRFTVAVSRARGVVAVVCSPALMTAPARTPEQLRMVNALCSYARLATPVTSEVAQA